MWQTSAFQLFPNFCRLLVGLQMISIILGVAFQRKLHFFGFTIFLRCYSSESRTKMGLAKTQS